MSIADQVDEIKMQRQEDKNKTV